jgi:hypothetical protein
MATGIRAIEVKRSKGVLRVTAIGETPKGQRILKKSIPLSVESPANPKFKKELADAVYEIMQGTQTPLPL